MIKHLQITTRQQGLQNISAEIEQARARQRYQGRIVHCVYPVKYKGVTQQAREAHNLLF